MSTLTQTAVQDVKVRPVGGLLARVARSPRHSAVPARRAGVASGVFNTSRRVGGALAVAVFGALLATRATFAHGLRVSLLIAAAVALAAAAASTLLRPANTSN